MKKYKTIFIDGRKIIRQMLYILCFLGLTLLFLPREINPQEMLKRVLPIMEIKETQRAGVGDKLKNQTERVVKKILQFDPGTITSVVAREIPLMDAVSQSGLAKLTQERYHQGQSPIELPSPTQSPEPPMPIEIPPERQAPIKEVDASPKEDGVVLGNETSYSINPEELLKEKSSISFGGEGPKVLVIHTHGTEAYAPEGSTVYDTASADRSEDCEKNVVKAGEVLCKIFQEKGIETIHDKTLHDTPSFNGSYAHALSAIEAYQEQYPSIQVVLDIHRDSIVYQDKTKAKVVTKINGQDAAQLMFVVGTDQKGLSHPDWRENIKNAVHLQNAIKARYPTLMRHINLRRERFNGHTAPCALIIETGSSGNSLQEAIYGLSLAAECMADFFLELL